MKVMTHEVAAQMLTRPNVSVRAWVVGMLVVVWDTRPALHREVEGGR